MIKKSPSSQFMAVVNDPFCGEFKEKFYFSRVYESLFTQMSVTLFFSYLCSRYTRGFPEALGVLRSKLY